MEYLSKLVLKTFITCVAGHKRKSSDLPSSVFHLGTHGATDFLLSTGIIAYAINYYNFGIIWKRLAMQE